MQTRQNVARARAFDGGEHRRLIVQPGNVAQADGVAGAEFEAEEILERAGEAIAPLGGGQARERRVVHQDRAGRRLVHLREQLDQRGLAGAVLADDRHHCAGGQGERHIVEHHAGGAWVGERYVLEPDALLQGLGNRQIALRGDGSGIVFQPGQPARAIHPETTQKSDLADGGADVGREPRARGQHQQHLRWPARAGRRTTNTTAPT